MGLRDGGKRGRKGCPVSRRWLKWWPRALGWVEKGVKPGAGMTDGGKEPLALCRARGPGARLVSRERRAHPIPEERRELSGFSVKGWSTPPPPPRPADVLGARSPRLRWWAEHLVEVRSQCAHEVLLSLANQAPQPLQLLDAELERARPTRVEGGSGPLHHLADCAHGPWEQRASCSREETALPPCMARRPGVPRATPTLVADFIG